MIDLDNILSNFKDKLSATKNKEDLQNLKSEFFGKNGSMSLQFKKWVPLIPMKENHLLKN